MPANLPAARPETAAALTPVTLAALGPKQLACLVVEPPRQLLVDCGGRPAPHPLGVCRFVSQLLHLRQRGTAVRLCNVHPVLRGCLHRLELGAVFPLAG